MSDNIETGDIVFLRGFTPGTVIKAMVGAIESEPNLDHAGMEPKAYTGEVLFSSDPTLSIFRAPIVVRFTPQYVLDILKLPRKAHA